MGRRILEFLMWQRIVHHLGKHKIIFWGEKTMF